MNIDNRKNTFNFDKLLNNYFVTFILIVVNITLYFKFGEKFGDLFIDVSREVTVPLRILDGQIIYKDFHYEYGPFVPYLFAVLCKIFGSGLDTFRFTGLAVSTIISFFIFRISSMYINRKYALLSSVVFIFIFAFHSHGVNIFNFIFPYSYTSIFGIMFLLLLYNKAYNYFACDKNIELIPIALILFICMLTKLEIMLSAVAVIILSTFLLIKKYNFYKLLENRDIVNSRVFYTAGLSLALISLFFIYVFGIEIVKYINNEIIYLVEKNLNSPMGKSRLGIDNFSYYLFRSAKSVLFFVSYGVIFLFLDKKTSINNSYSFFKLLIFLITLFMSSFYISTYGYNYLYFGTGIFLMMFILYLSSLIYCRHESKNKKEKILLIVSVSSLALVFRIIFNNTVDFYGFYLLVPASVCIIIAIYYYIPLIARYRFKRRSGFFKSAFSVFFLIMCFSAYSNTSMVATNKNKLLQTEKGLLYVYEYQYFSVQSMLNDFKGKIKNDDTILILPEGYMLNYFLGITPTSFNNAHIPDLVEGDREIKLIEEIAFKKFDYIIIVPRYALEWGLPIMGKDYLKDTVKYIYDKYDPILLYGDLPFSDFNKFGILVLKKRSNQSSVNGEY
jgi:hypothetical protein